MLTQFVQPADGLKVRDPEKGGHLPAVGREVPLTPYWRRRLKDEDVVKAFKPKAEKPSSGKTKE
ncbi:MAG: DUF2635 domain-containing protein [Alphaproteobacteria bacterium]|nr:DUF2635 domain-containing protein [Alphaproteobacteria bacterium]